MVLLWAWPVPALLCQQTTGPNKQAWKGSVEQELQSIQSSNVLLVQHFLLVKGHFHSNQWLCSTLRTGAAVLTGRLGKWCIGQLSFIYALGRALKIPTQNIKCSLVHMEIILLYCCSHAWRYKVYILQWWLRGNSQSKHEQQLDKGSEGDAMGEASRQTVFFLPIIWICVWLVPPPQKKGTEDYLKAADMLFEAAQHAQNFMKKRNLKTLSDETHRK